MIIFDLICKDCSEIFEGWFGNFDEYKEQQEKGLLSCPVCTSYNIEKQLASPAISKKANQQTNKQQKETKPKDIRKIVQDFRQYVFDNFDNVGDQFAKESLKMHYGEVEERNIYGSVTKEEAIELTDEGVETLPLPNLPKTH